MLTEGVVLSASLAAAATDATVGTYTVRRFKNPRLVRVDVVDNSNITDIKVYTSLSNQDVQPVLVLNVPETGEMKLPVPVALEQDETVTVKATNSDGANAQTATVILHIQYDSVGSDVKEIKPKRVFMKEISASGTYDSAGLGLYADRRYAILGVMADATLEFTYPEHINIPQSCIAEAGRLHMFPSWRKWTGGLGFTVSVGAGSLSSAKLLIAEL